MSGSPEPAPPELAEGVRLFNQGRYFEAHEVLERAWLAEPSALRLLYQGLLQVGVGLHHARRGNLDGALRLLDRGMARLAPFAPRRLGLDVEGLLREAAAARRALARPGGLAAFDWDRAPRARLDVAGGPAEGALYFGGDAGTDH